MPRTIGNNNGNIQYIFRLNLDNAYPTIIVKIPNNADLWKKKEIPIILIPIILDNIL